MQNIYLRRLLIENGVQLRPIRQDATFAHLEEIRNGTTGPDPLPLPFHEDDQQPAPVNGPDDGPDDNDEDDDDEPQSDTDSDD